MKRIKSPFYRHLVIVNTEVLAFFGNMPLTIAEIDEDAYWRAFDSSSDSNIIPGKCFTYLVSTLASPSRRLTIL